MLKVNGGPEKGRWGGILNDGKRERKRERERDRETERQGQLLRLRETQRLI